MANDSSTGGYLSPLSGTALSDRQFNEALQGFVAGVSGLSLDLVRPRWQNPPLPTPDDTVNWVAMGIHRTSALGMFLDHDPNGGAGVGTSDQTEWSIVEVLISFYGPEADFNSRQFCAGATIGQNWEVLRGKGLLFRDLSDVITAPRSIHTTWFDKKDVTLSVWREIKRTWGIRNVESAHGNTVVDSGNTDNFVVES